MNSAAPSVASVPSVLNPPPVLAPWPIVFILALALRIRAGFGEVLTSITRIIDHSREQIRRQEQLATAVRAIDDELEREFPLFVELFANDPPKKRARALAILRELHARTELRATQAAPRCPSALLQDT